MASSQKDYLPEPGLTAPLKPPSWSKAAGWVDGGLTDGGEHSRPSRRRGLAVDAKPKRRWWAPWSKRATSQKGA